MIRKKSNALERSVKYFTGGPRPVSQRQPRRTMAHLGKWKKTKQYKYDSKEVNPFPAGDHKDTRNSMAVKHTPTWSISNKNEPQRSNALERSVKNFLLECLNRFHGAKFTLSSDGDQDT